MEITTDTYWRPSNTLRKILCRLYEDDYTQFPCVPCSYCSRLLYPHSAKWIIRDETVTYPFQSSFPETPLITHPRYSAKIAVCDSCKSNSNNQITCKLAPIPLNVFKMLLMPKENIFLPSTVLCKSNENY